MEFNFELVLLALPVLLLSLTAHEFAHAWVALKQGDDTAYMLGRVTMNPAAHVDVIGTLVFPAIAIGSGMPLLGWAKPVPVNTRKLRDFRRGDILVSIAGVIANAILAVLFTVLFTILYKLSPSVTGPASETLDIALNMMLYGVYGNVGLIIFNLLPIPPLDGSRVLMHYLSAQAAQRYLELYPYGMIILWGLVLTGAVRIIGWPIRAISNLLLLPSGVVL